MNGTARIVRGLISGLLLGAGLAVFSVLNGLTAAGTRAPWAVYAIAAVVGIGAGALIPRRRRPD